MDWRTRIEGLPRLGWVDAPSPVEPHPALGASVGVPDLWVKRDDALGAAVGLPGGTKIRKLDVMLATPPWRDAPAWASVGAIGSGQLVALSAAARLLGRRLRAHLFWEPPLPELLENLAFVASGPGELRYVHTRVGLALRHPRVLTARMIGRTAVVPPGATVLPGELGVVLGALELAAQVRMGLCPPPRHVFVPLGSGGTTSGLLAGFALAGLDCTVHAVSTVERLYALEGPLRTRVAAVLAHLGAGDCRLPRLVLHRDQLGPGYGVATEGSLAACARWASDGVGLEPIYSGKAMAGLMAAAPSLDGPVLFWLTPRRPGPLPAAPDWVDRLPRALRRRLAPGGERALTRRKVLLGLGGAATLAGVWRFTGYPDPPDGLLHLPRWAAGVLAAACAAVLDDDAGAGTEAADDIVRRVDGFLATQPGSIRVQVLGALALVEQGGGLLTAEVRRFSRVSVSTRRAILTALADRGGLVAEAGRAVRDLVVLGHYQRPSSWGALGYGGPWVPESPRPDAYTGLATDAPPPGFEVMP
jgi:D-cysteine desulfhydrase